MVFVDWQGTRIDNALFIGVQVARALSAVPVDVDSPGALSSLEPSCLLVECICLGCSRTQRFATILSAAGICIYLVVFVGEDDQAEE